MLVGDKPRYRYLFFTFVLISLTFIDALRNREKKAREIDWSNRKEIETRYKVSFTFSSYTRGTAGNEERTRSGKRGAFNCQRARRLTHGAARRNNIIIVNQQSKLWHFFFYLSAILYNHPIFAESRTDARAGRRARRLGKLFYAWREDKRNASRHTA